VPVRAKSSRSLVPPMHGAGRPFVALGACLTLVLGILWRPLALVGALLTGFVAWFFRNPVRETPGRSGVVFAPADGRVVQVAEAMPPPELGIGRAMVRISVFLSLFDVHVQRFPTDAEILRVAYRPGRFVVAARDKASEDNERNALLLRTSEGYELAVVQIAGIVARRIVCQAAAGTRATAGRTFGLIRFGSRVDTYLPLESRVVVERGQRTTGGVTVLAELGAVASETEMVLMQGSSYG
jgi:phosphatidylserine decarboxylase